jgi:hypothetical protein
LHLYALILLLLCARCINLKVDFENLTAGPLLSLPFSGTKKQRGVLCLSLLTKGAADHLHCPLVDSAKACLPLSWPEQNVRFFPDASRKLFEYASFQDAGLKIAQTLSRKAAHALYLTNVDLCK